MSVTVKVRRKDELARKLKQLAPEALKEMTEANRKSAEEMVSLAKNFVPKKTGKLAESIQARGPGEIPPAYSQGGKSLTDTGAYLVSVGNSQVRYAHLVEFGTAPHAQPNNPRVGYEHPGTAAQPYFFPAYRLTARRHKNRASRALNKSVKKVASG